MSSTATWEEVAAQAAASPCCHACGRPFSDVHENTEGKHHRDGRDTERKAAYSQRPRSGTVRARVLDVIAHAGAAGCTDEELSNKLSIRWSSAGTRRGELVEGGWVTDSGRRRKTATGADAIVWVLTDAAQHRPSTGLAACDGGGLTALET